MAKIIVFGNGLQTAYGLIRAFGEAGYKVDFLLEPCKPRDCTIRHSKYIQNVFFLENLDKAPEVLLEKYGKSKDKPVVLCASDPSIAVLDKNFNELKNHFYIFNANNCQGRICHFQDKINSFEVAAKNGLTIINTLIIEDAEHIPDGISYPCFVKGLNSVESTKSDIHICANPKELKSSLRPGVRYLVQDYIQKDFEMTVVGVSFNNGKDVILKGVTRKVRESLKRMGEFMCLDPFEKHPNLNLKGIKGLVREIGYEGIFSLDFLCKDDTYYFLEINLRNDGLGYVTTAAGANFPYLWYKYAIGRLTSSDIEKQTVKTPFFVMHENDMYNIVEGKVSVCQWIKDFHKTSAFFTMNIKDPLPFIASTLVHTRQFMKLVYRKISRC